MAELTPQVEHGRRPGQILMAIHPQRAFDLLSGDATAVLRRQWPRHMPVPVTCWLFATAPMRALVGSVSIERIQRVPDDLICATWTGRGGGLNMSVDEARLYLAQQITPSRGVPQVRTAMVLSASNPRPLVRPATFDDLKRIWNWKHPPRDWTYITPISADELASLPAG